MVPLKAHLHRSSTVRQHEDDMDNDIMQRKVSIEAIQTIRMAHLLDAADDYGYKSRSKRRAKCAAPVYTDRELSVRLKLLILLSRR